MWRTIKYRKFGKLNWKGSGLGFGCMRLPLTDADSAHVDGPASIQMIRYAIDNGVNYVDSAYTYHMGCSEVVLGRALQGGYREKVKLATKLPSMLVQSAGDFDRYLNEQLERLQTNRIDFYLLHWLNKDHWSKLQSMEIFRWTEKAMADGRISYLGFSFHDDFKLFKTIIDAFDNWTFCQIQYNYMDINKQAGTRGLEYASQKGLAVVIMAPLRGGRLSRCPPPGVAKLWATATVGRTPTEWALLWVWEHPEVSVVLSGMSTMSQVVENVTVANRCGPGVLTSDDMVLIDQVRQAYHKLGPVPCTGCGYCLPCPNGVDIPHIFEFYNDAFMYDDPKLARRLYNVTVLKKEQRADRCIDCMKCSELCPQEIPIAQWLQKAHEFLSYDK